MLEGQPEVAANTLQLFGAGAFGAVIGWSVYHINRHRTDDVQLSDVVTLILALGGAAVMALFAAKGDLFGAYGIGLAAGFFLYFLILVVMVNKAPRFDAGWFIDGRAPLLLEEEKVSAGKGMDIFIGRGMGLEGRREDDFESLPVPKPLPAPRPSPDTSAVTDQKHVETSERPDLVNLGFSHGHAADKKVQKTEPLQCGQLYYFWLRISKDIDEAGIGTPPEIRLDQLPAEAVLTVAIFSFKDELVITPGQDVGELKIQKDGSVKVLRQPDEKSISLSADAPSDHLERHLVFPISVPNNEATHRLRCNIYCRQVLVQSHVISAKVKNTLEPIYPEACSRKLDYVLSESLSAAHLAGMTEEPHLLSLMMNDNGDGSSNFRFFGSAGGPPYKADANIDGPQFSGFLLEARAALRRVSWGVEEEWNGDDRSYRYQTETFDERKLAKDLAYLARAGWNIYSGVSLHLGNPFELEELLANSGQIQIALKLSPRAVLPAAVIYDYAWNANLFHFPTTDFQLCPSFSKALKAAREGGPPLEDCICFHGGCELKQMIADALKNDTTVGPVICPSGFWGYRHLLGLPLTLSEREKDKDKDIAPVIEYTNPLQMFACVSTDSDFKQRDAHLERLQDLHGVNFARDDNYAPFVTRLRKSGAPQVLYFYCHGGVTAGTRKPFLQVGSKDDRRDEINPPNWLSQKIRWTGPNPLVFINGCHTTSLNPEVTLDFVSSFVAISGAAGVIGTEITIFEPLAVKFAEECFKRFIGAEPHKELMPIGKAVRGARLELLRQGNPLGLVYIPYAVASLRLEEKK